jgi:hypothetical protein
MTVESQSKISKSQQLLAKYKDQRQREKLEAKKFEDKRKIILGGTVIAAARENPEFARQFSHLIEKYVRQDDRKYVTGWLPAQTSE